MKNKKMQKPLAIGVGMAVVIAITLNITEDSKVQAEEFNELDKEENNVNKEMYLLNDAYSDNVIYQTAWSLEEMSPKFKAVNAYVERAEELKTGEAIYLAELLVDKLNDDEKMILSERLNQLKPKELVNTSDNVLLAQNEVSLAEANIHDEEQLKKAQQSVHDLYMSKERTDLVERLHEVHKQLLLEREEEK